MSKGKRKKMLYLLIVLLGVVVAGQIIFNLYMMNTVKVRDTGWKSYSRHYAFISDMETAPDMWQQIYQGAKEYGEENDIYVERVGDNLVEQYSKRELMEMATASGVDGIIVEGDDTADMNNLINEANDKGIPVITVMKDSFGSYRKSFVGISAYNLGQEYGRLIAGLREDTDTNMLVVINTSTDDSSEKITYSGLRETLAGIDSGDIHVSTLIVDGSSDYSTEETIRNYLLDTGKLPRLIVCMNEQTTETFSQLMVDYNRVGESKVIGFHSSENILQAVAHGIVTASITLDAKDAGRTAAEALAQYQKSGYVSDYIPETTEVITPENAATYLDSGENAADE